jgi:ubiquinone/menaquinone biosynthesis C-methylase UbiE
LGGLIGCNTAVPPDSAIPHNAFPAAQRPIAPLSGDVEPSEAERDKDHEAKDVMTATATAEGMTVADLGAGEGYYTVRLAAKVGKKGRVLAEDIVPTTRDALALRVSREHWDNVSIKLGTPEDPSLPTTSFDHIFMMHMYHEIDRPFEFLWRMRPSLTKDGEVDVVDMDRPIVQHGIPPALLICEFGQVGYHFIGLKKLGVPGAYLARFNAVGNRPAPDQIKPCALG